jgi:hypothetical protein
MLRLEKRPTPSRFWLYATPPVAVILTMIAGGILFATMGKNPFEVIRTIFWDPVFGEFAFYLRSPLASRWGSGRGSGTSGRKASTSWARSSAPGSGWRCSRRKTG